MIGTVKYWNAKRGYGFVVREDGSGDVFCHVSSLAEGLEGLAVGNKVEFDETVSPHSGGGQERPCARLGALDHGNSCPAAFPSAC